MNPHKKIVNCPMWEPKIKIKDKKIYIYQKNQLINPQKKIVNSPMWEPKIKKKGKK